MKVIQTQSKPCWSYLIRIQEDSVIRCHTMKGDLLVSMRSLDKQQSIIVMYSWIRENQIGILGDSFLSVDSWEILRLNESFHAACLIKTV